MKNFKKIVKILAVIAAIVAAAAGIYLAVKKLTEKKTPEYFDDNDFFECDNEIEIVEVEEEPAEEAVQEEAKKPAKKASSKKKAAKKADAE